MRPTPSSPRTGLPAILALTFAAFLPQLSSGGTPFPQDLEPLSHVGRESKLRIGRVTMATRLSEVALKAKQRIMTLHWGAGRGGGVKVHIHRKQACTHLFSSGSSRSVGFLLRLAEELSTRCSFETKGSNKEAFLW